MALEGFAAWKRYMGNYYQLFTYIHGSFDYLSRNIFKIYESLLDEFMI